MEPRALASYPFLREAAEFVRSRGPTLDALLHDIAYGEVRALGVERVRAALVSGELPLPACRSDRECLNELLTYVCARMVVSAAASPHLIRRYALAEAKRAGRMMRGEPLELLLSIAAELEVPVSVAPEGAAGARPAGGLLLHFSRYLRLTAGISGWKLVNRPVAHGQVHLSGEDLCRVLEEALRRRFERELPLELPDEVRDAFGEAARALRAEAEAGLRRYQPAGVGKIRVACFPPCMRHLLAMAQSGENVPHSGRFSLVAFLHAVGASTEDMMRAFATSPDFKEDKTRYQVEHITGVSSKTEYTPPSCDTMRTYGLCVEPDSLCAREWMSHPLKYYRVKTRARRGAAPPPHR
ncbi:MAG: DNA primase regulatory subunit PriL [Thermoplasmatota archaeon]